MSKTRVLIVDDSKLIRQFTGRILRDHGMKVETAVDGQDGCRKVFDFQPDVILMDLTMPKMSGTSAVKFLKSNNQTKHIPIVVLTNESNHDEKLKVLEAGANDLVSKDAHESELVTRVKNLAQMKALEDELLLQRDQLGNILNDLAQAVVILDNAETVIIANAAARSLLNIPAELVGRLSVRELIESAGGATEFVDKLRDDAAEELMVDLNTSYGCKTFQVRFSSVFMSGQDLFGKALIFWDVTQEQEMEKMKAAFHSMIAHDLRSPITVITGYTDLLLHKKAGELSDLQMEFLEAIENRTNALRKLVDEFLAVSKFEGTSITLDAKAVDLNNLVREVVDSLGLIAANKKIEVVFDLDQDLPVITADEDKLYKVFSNLYDNALKYTPEGGKVQVRNHRRDDRIVVEIQDNGIGIEDEEIEFVFDRYKRMATAERHKIKGTGLGLAIVKQIVTAHGGRVWVESEADAGSTFFVELPLTINAKETADLAEVT